MRFTRLTVAGLAALALIAPAAAQETGSIKGTFVLKGTAPKLPEIIANKDPQVCAAQPIRNEMLILDPDSKGVANVFVWVAKFDAKKLPAELQKPKDDAVVLDNKNCTFVPHCVIARAGQTLTMLNSDAVGHNVHTNPVLGGGAINQLIPPQDKEGLKRPLGKAEVVPIPVQCDIHPWMRAHMLILDHPYAALSDEKGTFTIEGLPPGKYDLKVWQEGGGYVIGAAGIKSVEVKAGETTDVGTTEIDVAKLKNLKP